MNEFHVLNEKLEKSLVRYDPQLTLVVLYPCFFDQDSYRSSDVHRVGNMNVVERGPAKSSYHEVWT